MELVGRPEKHGRTGDAAYRKAKDMLCGTFHIGIGLQLGGTAV